jgi:[ribosomal protein S5]-alanine N-acetyltransferase
MLSVPPLTTERLVVRPLQMSDLGDVYGLLDATDGELFTDRDKWQARSDWLQWTILGYKQFANLNQPPFGERAITLRDSGHLIGLAGYVPVFDALPQIPALAPTGGALRGVNSGELGLYYNIRMEQRRRGYAAEAARALIAFAFEQLRVWRIVAMTTRDNEGSIAVMRRLGMAILTNPHPEPEHLQVVGVRYNPDVISAVQP